jgi:hypothetical protein
MEPSANPYAPPKHDEPFAVRPTDGSIAELEAIRRAHINAETNVKGLGVLIYIGAAAMILTALRIATVDAMIALLSLVFGGVLGLSAYWLRRLDRRGRLVYTIVVALGFVSMLFEIGSETFAGQLGRTLWSLLFLAMVWSRKASTVMTPHYRDVVIPATPHVKRKTSPVLIVLLVLLLLGLVVVIVAGVA